MEWISQKFELSRGERGNNVRPMEGLRGFAVFLVFLVHYVTFIRPWIIKQSSLDGFANAVHSMGNTGVDLFFVLSGYLIYGSLISRPQRFVRFMSRRVERIYPAFAVVFVIYIVLSLVSPAQNKIPTTGFEETIYLLENFLLLPGLFPIEPMITVAWSLSYEIFFYLAIPFVILAFGLRRRSVAQRVSLFLATAAAIAICSAAVGGPVRLIMFIAGMLLHEVASNRPTLAPGSGIGLLALGGGVSHAPPGHRVQRLRVKD
jgi:exopolysaccharide production protein ExoZ